MNRAVHQSFLLHLWHRLLRSGCSAASCLCSFSYPRGVQTAVCLGLRQIGSRNTRYWCCRNRRCPWLRFRSRMRHCCFPDSCYFCCYNHCRCFFRSQSCPAVLPIPGRQVFSFLPFPAFSGHLSPCQWRHSVLFRSCGQAIAGSPANGWRRYKAPVHREPSNGRRAVCSLCGPGPGVRWQHHSIAWHRHNGGIASIHCPDAAAIHLSLLRFGLILQHPFRMQQ